ncbi:lytic transglycosylase catalytic subunit, partial [marine sediment metagenome]
HAVKSIQRKLRAQGIDDKSWANVYAYLADNKASNSRYGQAMHYVSNIRSYLESIKTQTV